MGSDNITYSSRRRYRNFNPRSRVGSDMSIMIIGTVQKISIHAPVWGATLDTGPCRAEGTDFNPRSRVGSDIIARFPRFCKMDFNPRSRVGSDLKHSRIKEKLCISIHAPVWGATFEYQLKRGKIVFQSTLPCGERPAGTNGKMPRA